MYASPFSALTLKIWFPFPSSKGADQLSCPCIQSDPNKQCSKKKNESRSTQDFCFEARRSYEESPGVCVLHTTKWRVTTTQHQDKKTSRGAIAQLGERLPCTQEVSGSIPLSSTITCFHCRNRLTLQSKNQENTKLFFWFLLATARSWAVLIF